MTNTPRPVDPAELAKTLLRVADIVEGFTQRYGTCSDGRARISEQAVLYATFDLDPVTYFDPANRENLALWQKPWRQTRRDGTRGHYNALRDAIRDTLAAELPGDWRTGGRYTPDQIRAIAHQITTADDQP